MMNRGIVIKSTGSRYTVKDGKGTYLECLIGGKLRIQDSKITNPVAVGDFVTYEINGDYGIIKSIEQRKNYIIRKSSNLSRQGHIIASNIDLAVLIVTVKYPSTLTTFIDRFLVTAEAYRIPAVLLFNKIDLFNEDEIEYNNAMMYVYEQIGYPCLAISIEKEMNMTKVRELMQGKICLLSGHSGVGKSSLIRYLDPSKNIRISPISDAHHKGKHTTTHSEMFELENNTFIIDTPGIKGFGVIDINKEEVYHFFPEFFKLSSQCQYYNCTHLHEPNCAVKDALDKDLISISRYNSYLSILSGDDNKHRK